VPPRLRVGTSGWDYPHWREVLYFRNPEALSPPPRRRPAAARGADRGAPGDSGAALPRSAWLSRYARVFSTVELNATFYRLPAESSVERWRDATPGGFVFAVKGSRYLTHLKRLRDTGPGLDRFFSRVRLLGPKLGPVLWQLPPQLGPDLPRLDAFLAALPGDVRHAVEFRSVAWYRDDVARLLSRHRVAFCEHDLVDRPIPRATGGFRYLRFHGAGARYGGRYGRARLAPAAEDLVDGRLPAFVYFNNDTGGAAVHDALDLLDLLAPAASAGEPARVASPGSPGGASP
jgi:uncharacterized protein YecE (DUF72 family)